jgi:hypothetical protein
MTIVILVWRKFGENEGKRGKTRKFNHEGANGEEGEERGNFTTEDTEDHGVF